MGHLLAVPPIMKELPADAQQPDVFEALCRAHEKYDKDSIIYVDMWPFADPMMVICSPVLAVQTCQELDLPKPPILNAFFNPLAGGTNLFTMNGREWRRSRSLFASGFSANYILQQAARIVNETEAYTDVLRQRAQTAEIFSLDDLTCWYMMDVIGAITMNTQLHSLWQKNPLATALRRQIQWHVLDNEWNLFIRWNPARPFVQWYNNYTMNRIIGQELDKLFAEYMTDETSASSRSVIHLAFAEYMAQRKGKPLPKTLDPDFKKWATIQIRLFMFAGHDSTASTICYCFYLLQRHPEALDKVRAEHDTVFGTNINSTADTIRQNPHLLNQLPYTTAVIKEVLRLFPPASAMRGGLSGVNITDTAGNQYPTEGMNIWILHPAVQRNPKYWPEPKAFRPERWLVGPEHPLYPVKGGWRPFEHGPRNCVGQTLAMLDMHITLVLVVREFEVRHAYDEWDAMHPKKSVKSVNGERAYQTMTAGSHPADGFPCRVTLRKEH